jgi:hypothetical protein
MSRAGTWRRVVEATVAVLAMTTAVSCGAPVDEAEAPSDDAGLDGGEAGTEADDAAADDPDEASGSPDGNEIDEAGEGGDSTEGGDVPEAIGTPIDVPAEIQDQGRPLADMRVLIEEGIREQCGGELCVDLEVEHSVEDRDECTFVETRPPQRSRVQPGSTVVIVAGTLPCPSEPQEGGGSGGEGSAPGEAGTTDGEGATEPDQDETDGSTSGDGS